MKAKNMPASGKRILSERDFERLSYMLDRGHFKSTTQLKSELSKFQVLPCHEIPGGVIRMNCRVSLQDLDTFYKKKMTLVYPFQAQEDPSFLSVGSMLGMALLGSQVGQVVKELDASAEVIKWSILKVEYPILSKGDGANLDHDGGGVPYPKSGDV